MPFPALLLLMPLLAVLQEMVAKKAEMEALIVKANSTVPHSAEYMAVRLQINEVSHNQWP